MNWQPNTTPQILQNRSDMLRKIRNFFEERKIIEVDTPALSQSANSAPYIESFNLDLVRFLHTSPEYPMKRLLAAGSGDIYQICKVWRSGESGCKHNPEFSLLEYYRVGFDYHQLMQEVNELLLFVIQPLNKNSIFVSYKALFLEKFSINPHISCKEQLLLHVANEIPSLNTEDLDQQALLDALLTHCIEPEFDQNCLTFIFDYPASQSSLSRLRDEKDYQVAERFEVYFGDLELGNGYHEELDASRNRAILETDNNTRIQKNLQEVPIDNLFLNACESGIPPCAGIAIGLDRVLMAITGEKSIQKVINFPWDKA